MTPTHEQLWEWITPERMQRVWSKIEMQADCWIWTGASTHDYGYIYPTIDGKECGVPVHRLMMVLCYGADFPDGLPVARHLVCDNTLCCNPRHVLVGTDEQNRADQTEQDQTNRRERIRAWKAAKRQKALEWLRDQQAQRESLIALG
jgi:HNH endonuclease